MPFRALVRQSYSAYYTDPEVLRAAGYGAPSGQHRPPARRIPARLRFDDSRLDAVRKRGQLWRDA